MSVGRMKKKGSSPIARMLAACIVGGGIVAAQDGAAQEAPSSNATVNLIRLLVKQHVITQEAADALLKQAEQEAVQAQRQTATVKAIAAQPPPAPATQLSTAATTPPPAGTLRIPYVPEIVKKQIKEDVRRKSSKRRRTKTGSAERDSGMDQAHQDHRRFALARRIRSVFEHQRQSDHRLSVVQCQWSDGYQCSDQQRRHSDPEHDAGQTQPLEPARAAWC